MAEKIIFQGWGKNYAKALSAVKALQKIHSAGGIKNIWIVLKGVINKARRDKIILCDPFECIKKPRPSLLQDNFWVKMEIDQFLRANIGDQLLPFYYVAIHTGMRLAELCGLRWDRIDFANNQISVTRMRDKYGSTVPGHFIFPLKS